MGNFCSGLRGGWLAPKRAGVQSWRCWGREPPQPHETGVLILVVWIVTAAGLVEAEANFPPLGVDRSLLPSQRLGYTLRGQA